MTQIHRGDIRHSFLQEPLPRGVVQHPTHILRLANMVVREELADTVRCQSFRANLTFPSLIVIIFSTPMWPASSWMLR